MGLGHVVEGHDVPAEAEEQVRAEGDEGPEGELHNVSKQKGWVGSGGKGKGK